MVVGLALPNTVLSISPTGGLTPASSHLEQNWGKVQASTPAPLTNCVAPSGVDCYNPGTNLTWVLTLDVCTTINSLCTGSAQSTILLDHVVALLDPNETYIPGTQHATTSPSHTSVFSTGLCSSASAPSECVLAGVPNDAYLRWNFSGVSLDGHPQAVLTYNVNLTGPDNSSPVDFAIVSYTVLNLPQNPIVDAQVFIANPVLNISKDCPVAVEDNSAIVYHVSLSNSGHQNATGVKVTDPAPAGVTFTGASSTSPTAAYTPSTGTWTGNLPAGSTVNVTFDGVVSTAKTSVTNVANYTTVPANTTFIHKSASCTTEVLHPSIAVKKTVKPILVSTVTSNLVEIHANVTNTGDTTLYNVSVIDNLSGKLTCLVTTLAPGASTTCTGSYTIPAGFTFDYSYDTVVANGSDFAGNNLTAQDSASVQVVHPSLTVVKTVDPTRVSDVTSNTIDVSALVTNTGDTTLYNVSVIDNLSGKLSCAATTLAVGASTTCTGSYTIPAGFTFDYSYDTVVANGTDFAGNNLTAQDSASVQVTHPTPATVTDTNFCPLPNGQFRLIYNKYVGSAFQLKSSNPGQFYYNVYSLSGMTTGTTLTVEIPYPFVTTGANPSQVFLNQPLPTCPSSPPSTNINSQFVITNATFGLSTYNPRSLGSVVVVTFELVGPSIAPGNQLWFAIHLSYGLKGQLFDQLAPGSSSCPSPPNTGPCAQLMAAPTIVINDPQAYTFTNSHSGATTVSSVNDFNSAAEPAGARVSDPVTPLAGAQIAIGLVCGIAVVGLLRSRQANAGSTAKRTVVRADSRGEEERIVQ